MMAKVLTARVGADGILRLDVPMGPELAGQMVELAVATYRVPETEAEKMAVIRNLAGTWQGDFERPPQGEHQERDSL